MSEYWEKQQQESDKRRVNLRLANSELENTTLRSLINKLEEEATRDEETEELYDRIVQLEKDMEQLRKDLDALKEGAKK